MTEPVRVEGLGELVRALRQAEAGLDDLKGANQAVARIVLGQARSLAPHRSGALAASGRANRAARKANVVFGSARVPYAGPVHWGWPARHIPAHPFVTDAAGRTQSQWVAAYEAELQALLDTI